MEKKLETIQRMLKQAREAGNTAEVAKLTAKRRALILARAACNA
jgi:hypothetical protein